MKKEMDKFSRSEVSRFKNVKLFLVLMITVFFCFGCFLILRFSGLWEKINSIEKIRAIVEKGGMLSFLVFVLFQILQTTVLQIPSIFVTIAGALVFGRWTAFFLSFIAIIIGSLIMFWIGRKVGRKFLNWMIGETATDKWIEKLTNGKYLFFLMMLFPLFPDDILCVVAGLTNMSFSFFFWTNVVARAIGLASTVFFGSGAIIPFSGWGLIVWGVIAVVIAVLFFLSVKYKDKLDNIIRLYLKRKK